MQTLTRRIGLFRRPLWSGPMALPTESRPRAPRVSQAEIARLFGLELYGTAQPGA